jgi:hypothetical protein
VKIWKMVLAMVAPMSTGPRREVLRELLGIASLDELVRRSSKLTSIP